MNKELFRSMREQTRPSQEARDALTEKGLRITGTSPDGRLVEAVEIPESDFFIGVHHVRPHRREYLFLAVNHRRTPRRHL